MRRERGEAMTLVCLEVPRLSTVKATLAADEEEGERWPPELHSSLWSLLPQELLLHHILPRLPFFHILQLRSVNSSWNALLSSSSSFWNLFLLSQPSPPLPLLAFLSPPSPSSSKYLFKWRQSCAARYPSETSPPSPDFLASRSHSWRSLSADCLYPRSLCRILSSDGGLLLLESRYSQQQQLLLDSRDSQKRQLLVCNPVSKACKALPPVDDPKFDSISDAAICSDSKLGEYVVIFRFSGPDSGAYLVYESGVQQYKALAVNDQVCADPFLRTSTTAVDPGFYWFSDDSVVVNSNYVPCYNRQRKALSKVRTLWPGKVVISLRSQIWRSSQGLATVACFEDRLGIWHLVSTSWILTEELPLKATKDCMFGGETAFSSVKIGDLLCLSTRVSGRVFFYDLVKKTWEWSRRCPYSMVLAPGFAFQPMPQAEV